MSAHESAVTTASRLLSQVRYLEAYPDTTLEELAAVYNTTVAAIESDLALLLQTGATMFPDDLIDVVRDEDYLSIRSNAQFEQSLRLTLPEAVALAFGLQNLAGIASEAERALIDQVLNKLSQAAGRDFHALLEQGAGSSEFAAEFDTIQQALDTNHRVEFRYASRHNPHYTPKEVFPYKALLIDGMGYLVGVDAQDTTDRYRMYRFDRMQDLQVSSQRTTLLQPPSTDFSHPFAFSDSDLKARLVISREMRWLAEQQNFRIQKYLDDGSLQIVTPVVSKQWLRDFLIEHARGVELVGPKALKEEMQAEIATTLQAYALE